MREVRFSVGPAPQDAMTNSWGGWPTAQGLQPYAVLRARVTGEPDPTTGYLCNITLIDRLIRERTIPQVHRCLAAGESSGERLIQVIARDLLPHAPPGAHWVDWDLAVTPYLHYATSAGAIHVIDLRQSFEFSAAHRLHCDELSDDDNRKVFGKCNNPSGHGHNYGVQVTVTGEPDARTGVLMAVPMLEQIVKERVIDRFDHKHLNEDCEEFAEVNPSVENISRVIWQLLDGCVGPARLKRVRVWETPKTYAEYEGPDS